MLFASISICIWLLLGFALLPHLQNAACILCAPMGMVPFVAHVHSSMKLPSLWMTFSCSCRHLSPATSPASFMAVVITASDKGMPLSRLRKSWIRAVNPHPRFSSVSNPKSPVGDFIWINLISSFCHVGLFCNWTVPYLTFCGFFFSWEWFP